MSPTAAQPVSPAAPSASVAPEPKPLRRGSVLIVGNPNVGKSALFNWLTNRYVTVSNYPGTTVEVSRGHSRRLGGLEVLDTPGMYSLLPITEEERVARAMLLTAHPAAVLHVIDAKNIQRMLGLTLQLIEAGLPVVLALNMADEAQAAGVSIDTAALSRRLGIAVVRTSATTGLGLAELARALEQAACRHEAAEAGAATPIEYPAAIEGTIAEIAPAFAGADGLNARSRALLLLQGDAEQSQCLSAAAAAARAVTSAIGRCAAVLPHPPHYHVTLAVKRAADALVAECVKLPRSRAAGWADRLSDLCMSPWTGLPILAAVLYFGLYQFVGVLGADTLVGWLEDDVFGAQVNPAVTVWVNWLLPWPWLADLFVGPYGIITLGLRYAVAIIFPVVGTFFIAFSILEDSGYLPRLAMLIDRVFKRIGLNGRAVIPLVLGLGCDTMATMVTRTLETRRERAISTLLLALAVPCSAQLGVILALLAGHPGAMALWAGVMVAVFLLAGLLAARLMPGKRPCFYMELPPLRLPRPMNVLVKTYTRMVWYFKEVLPLFVIASVVIWLGGLDFGGALPKGGLFAMAVDGLRPVVMSMGLPADSAVAFLFGFFRRDYGAAGLYDLHGQGGLSGNQLAVAAISLTLFLPCVAQLLMMLKERGWRATVLMALLVVAVAYGVGWLVNLGLVVTGVRL
jgi:ferrous iron transport protein B